MRPIHAVLLLVALAAVLVGALLLVQGDGRSGQIASAIPESGRSSTDVDTHGAALDPAGAAGMAADRTKVTNGAATIITGPVGVTGRVLDPEGRPVVGAAVFAAPSGGLMGVALDDLDLDAPWARRVQATTGADGRFTLRPEAHGAVRIAVRADGFAPFDVEKAIAGASADLGDIGLERGAVLHGRVVDPSMRPVPNATLHLVRPGAARFAPRAGGSLGAVLATTDQNGAFTIDRLAVGPWSLVVTSDEHPDKLEAGETDRAGQVVPNLLITLAEGTAIEGRVAGASREALAQLSVRALLRTPADEGAFAAYAGVRTARVSPDGTFHIGGCERDASYRVVARSGERGFGSQARSESVEVKSGDRNVVLNYRSETAIAFQVVAADDGRPIETLNVSAGYHWLLPLMEEDRPTQRTRFEGGRVRYGGLAANEAGEPAQFRIESAGFQPFERKDLRLVAGRDNDLGVIRLERSALVRVTVLEESTGAPIAGAQVSLNEVSASGTERGMTFTFDVGAEEDGFLGDGAAHRGKTDAGGVADLSSMPGKRVTISVRHKAHATWKSSVIELPPSGDTEQTVRLASGGTVVVEVVDARNQPVAGVSIDHRDADAGGVPFLPGLSSDTVTDAAGRVVFAHIAAGRHYFRTRSGQNGFALGGGAAVIRRVAGQNGDPAESEKGWMEALVPEGDTVTVRMIAPEMGELTGRVRESGKALAGASVRLKSTAEGELDFAMPFMDQGQSATTNAAGEYALHGVAAGDYRVVVTHPARSMPFEGETTVASGANRCDVELPLAIVEGRVTGEDKKPLAGVKVSAERDREGASMQMSVVMIADDADGGEGVSIGSGLGLPSVNTDADGRYRLRGVTPGVGLRVVASGKDVQTTRSERIELSGDQTLANVDIVMKQGGTVQVVVRRVDGRAASGCIIRAEPQGDEAGDGKTLFTGPDGQVTFTGLEPGRWRITCRTMGLDPESRASKIPPQDVVVAVGTPKKVTFDVTD